MTDGIRIRAADDADVILTNLRRNRVIERATAAGLANGATIPIEIFLGAGYSEAEVTALPSSNRTWPIMENELR